MLDFILDLIIDEIRKHPVAAALAVWAFIRLFGTTIQTGWTGVLFTLGRAKRELEPGFHPLLPVIHRVRKTPVRSITLDLPRQRVTTSDGLVYDVDASVVYRIADATKALTQVDHLKKGCEALLTLAMQEVLNQRTGTALQERAVLDDALTQLARQKLAAWGVEVEQAGFTSIAPTKMTLRLTQQSLRVAERQRVMEEYAAHGLPPALAVALLGSPRQLVGHARARYRRNHRKGGPARWPALVAVHGVSLVAGTSLVAISHDEAELQVTTEVVRTHRELRLLVGETRRLRLTSRRPVTKIIMAQDAPLVFAPSRDDANAIDVSATKEGTATIVLSNEKTGAEAVTVTIGSW
jgi:hypothetical protein